ncbi:DUF1648 domain-containing protein [Streptomyces sp. NPDC093252]|uniref:DUF1648 domain-containing protein n=1 Tax=Streptomyces sp. NPDC093252 TaxID=3154980 RepID=UPI003419AF3F
MTATLRRPAALPAVPFGLATAAYLGVFLAGYDRLPGELATHFSGRGGADGFMSRTAALWSGGGLLIALGVLFTVLTAAADSGAKARLTAAIGAGTAVTLGYPLVVTVLVNLDAPDPAAARLPLWHLAVLLLAGLTTAAVAWRLVDAGPDRAPAAPVPPLPLADGETAAWSRTVLSRPLLLPALAVALGGPLALLLGPWPLGAALIVLGLACAAFAAIRVTVDRRGVTVASTLLPRPRLTVPLTGITGAASVRVDAVGDFGGWGYRIRPDRRGVVLRSGDALAVRTTAGREYVVTVDDPATAAALLNALVERRAGGRAGERD